MAGKFPKSPLAPAAFPAVAPVPGVRLAGCAVGAGRPRNRPPRSLQRSRTATPRRPAPFPRRLSFSSSSSGPATAWPTRSSRCARGCAPPSSEAAAGRTWWSSSAPGSRVSAAERRSAARSSASGPATTAHAANVESRGLNLRPLRGRGVPFSRPTPSGSPLRTVPFCSGIEPADR